MSLCVCACPQGILERLNAGEVVIGDGGFVFALEKRGYVKAGPWTPEAAHTHPESGKKYTHTCRHIFTQVIPKPQMHMKARGTHTHTVTHVQERHCH